MDMNISRTLDAIESLIRFMSESPENERILIYTSVTTLLAECEEFAKDNEVPNSNIGQYNCEVIHSCRCLARLDDDGHDDSQHRIWARGGVNKLKSWAAFDVASQSVE